jgi:hypothetical protein
MDHSEQLLDVGDTVTRMRKPGDTRQLWDRGVVVLRVPAGVSPMALFRRWLKDKGECRMHGSVSPVMHKERYIIRVVQNGKTAFYCPRFNTITKA